MLHTCCHSPSLSLSVSISSSSLSLYLSKVIFQIPVQLFLLCCCCLCCQQSLVALSGDTIAHAVSLDTNNRAHAHHMHITCTSHDTEHIVCISDKTITYSIALPLLLWSCSSKQRCGLLNDTVLCLCHD